ncbi:MAG: DUF6273 domain-containing protein [Eubacteriales bacterium]
MATLGGKSIGSSVFMEENGTKEEYIIVHHGLPSSDYDASCNGTWVFRKDILSMKSWDSTGVNGYSSSTIHNYLNGDFLSIFSTYIQNQIKSIKLPFCNNGAVSKGSSGLLCKAFLLSGYEIGWTTSDAVMLTVEGAKLSYFISGTSTDAEALRIATFSYVASRWWLRTSYQAESERAWYVANTASFNIATSVTEYGVRPAFILPSTMSVTDSGLLTDNSAPSNGSAFFPSTYHPSVGDTVTLTWYEGSDVDGNLEGYVVSKSLDKGTSWTEIYRGPALSTTDLIPDVEEVQYRIFTFDSLGAESSTRGTQVYVKTNTPPQISGSDENLGQFTTAFTKTYIVTDDEGGVVTVSEKVNGVLLKSFSVTLGGTNTFSFSQADWAKLGNGNHVLTITATDSEGESATRTFSFSKMETEIHLQYLEAYETTNPVSLGILTVKKEIPEGATFSAEVCNNGFDDNPTWENVTAAVNSGGRFYLNNATKTASKWGYNVRIKVDRGTAVGECCLSEVSGYYK